MLSIIIPTYNNAEYLNPCVVSILHQGIVPSLAEIVIVNNGTQPVEQELGHIKGVKVVTAGKNLGWEGGLVEGMKHSDSKYICFQNDDTFIPVSSKDFYRTLWSHFEYDEVGAVGPSTTVASSPASVFSPSYCTRLSSVGYLIFFCVMLRRDYVERVGGVDLSLPGGDDFDLCIRLRKAGKACLIDPSTFILHHAFKTGTRVHGDHTVQGGWNSQLMYERTQKALIQKHGFANYFDAIIMQPRVYERIPICA